MKKVVMYRSLTVSVASAFVLAACVPSWSPVAPQSTGAALPTESTSAQAVPQETLAAGTVKGLVMAFNKLTGQFEPVVGAQVQVMGTDLVALTAKDGSYTLNGVKPGKHEVLVTREGFDDGKTSINANPVSGLNQVNVAMVAAGTGGALDGATAAGDTYELQQVASPNEAATNAPAPREVSVVGVVTDPRGCAVPNAKVAITTSGGAIAAVGASSATVEVGSPMAGSVLTTPSGFFAFKVENAVGLVEVRAGAYGFSPGRIAMERKNLLITSTIGDTLPMSLQMDSFQAVAQPRPAGGQSVGALVPGGLATVQVDSGLSERADEFYIRVRRGSSLVDVWEVLPLAVTSTNGVGTVQFRVPSLIPTGQVQIQLVQLGIQGTGFAPEFNAIGYTATTFENSVVAGAATLADDSTQSGVNFGLLEKDDEAVYELPLQNTNGSVSVQLNLVAELASGAIPVAASLTGLGTPIATASLGNNRWRFSGLFLPAAESRTFSLRIRNEATGLPHDGAFFVRQVTVEEPNFSYTKALPSGDRTGANALTYREFLNTGPEGLGWSGYAKVFEDDPATAGAAFVRITFNPPSDTRPLTALRITDITDTDKVAPANPQIDAQATRAGTTVTGLADLGTLVLEVDGVARQIPVANNASTTSITTQYENFGGVPGSVTFEKPNNGAWRFIRNSSAPGSSIAVRGTTGTAPTSTAAVLTAMGISASGIPMVATSGGITVTLDGATVTNSDGSPSAWTIRAVRNDTVVDGTDASVTIPANSVTGLQFPSASIRNGMAAAAFELVPPAQVTAGVNPLANRNAPVVVRYRVRTNDGSSIRLGGANHVGGGFNSITRLVGYSLLEGPAGDRYATFTAPVGSGLNVQQQNVATSSAF